MSLEYPEIVRELRLKIKELERKLASAEKDFANLALVNAENERKIAESEKKIKSFDAYVMRDEKLAIAVEALEEIREYTSDIGSAYFAEEALKKIKG